MVSNNGAPFLCESHYEDYCQNIFGCMLGPLNCGQPHEHHLHSIVAISATICAPCRLNVPKPMWGLKFTAEGFVTSSDYSIVQGRGERKERDAVYQPHTQNNEPAGGTQLL